MRSNAAAVDLRCFYGKHSAAAAAFAFANWSAAPGRSAKHTRLSTKGHSAKGSSILVCLVLLAGCAEQMPDRPVQPHTPVRIVSINPCVDAVLKEVADPGQIAAISHYSHDPRATSVPLDWARRYPAVSGAAEDVIAANPDLVLAGPHVALQTIDALKRLGIPVMQIPVPETVAQNKAQIAAIAAKIGRPRAGDALNRRIDAALAKAHSSAPPVSALIWQGSGLVPGKGTLADELLTRTGFRNVSSRLGLEKWDILPLEELLMQPPDVLLSGEANRDSSRAESRMLSHPALRTLRTRIHVAAYPSNLLNCGGPVIIQAAAHLADIRQSLKVRP